MKTEKRWRNIPMPLFQDLLVDTPGFRAMRCEHDALMVPFQLLFQDALHGSENLLLQEPSDAVAELTDERRGRGA